MSVIINTIENSPRKNCYSINEHTLDQIGADESNLTLNDPIIVFYDLGDTDDMEPEAAEKFKEEAETELDSIVFEMICKGYSLVFDNDGSGNGMIYGAWIFDKVS